MKFKVGDKVRMIRNTYGNRGKIGTLEKIDTSTMPYCVVFDDGRKEWCYGNEFKLLEEEKVMKFKVGDKVKVKDSWFGRDGQVGVVFKVDNLEPYNYSVKFHVEGDNERRDENFMGDSLELVTEEEKVMRFKVGDKVKILNTEFGNKDKIGTITNISGIVLIYLVEIEGDYGHVCQWSDASDLELVREEELELVKEKQSFTKSDLKTGMGVVLRNGRKGHVLVDTGCVDVIRFLENGNYSCLNDFSDNLTSNYREEHDIVEVYFTEYQFKLLTDQVFDQDCVFKREPEPTKMTMKEINEHFGKPIEIVE